MENHETDEKTESTPQLSMGFYAVSDFYGNIMS
jgi:hypothetical protein